MTHSKASFSSAQIKRLIKLRAVVKVTLAVPLVLLLTSVPALIASPLALFSL